MVERLSVILHLFGSRGLPTFLFVVMALFGVTAAARSSGPADLIFRLTGVDSHLPLYDEKVPLLAEFNFG